MALRRIQVKPRPRLREENCAYGYLNRHYIRKLRIPSPIVGGPDTLWNSAPHSSPICRGRQTLWPVVPQSLKGSISERLAAPMLLNRKPRRPGSERRATWTCQRHGSVPVASQDAHNDNPLRAPSQSHEPSRQTRPIHPPAYPLLPIPRLQSAIFATPFVNAVRKASQGCWPLLVSSGSCGSRRL